MSRWELGQPVGMGTTLEVEEPDPVWSQGSVTRAGPWVSGVLRRSGGPRVAWDVTESGGAATLCQENGLCWREDGAGASIFVDLRKAVAYGRHEPSCRGRVDGSLVELARRRDAPVEQGPERPSGRPPGRQLDRGLRMLVGLETRTIAGTKSSCLETLTVFSAEAGRP